LAADIRQGLEECLQHIRGEISARESVVESPGAPPLYSAEDIKRLRKRARMSHKLFAILVNASLETVQGWEKGRSSPPMMARRYLRRIEQNPDFIHELALGKAEDQRDAKNGQARSRKPPAHHRSAVAMSGPKSVAKAVQRLKS
jgi:DNA-binding transcriptional regulator YiaG